MMDIGMAALVLGVIYGLLMLLFFVLLVVYWALSFRQVVVYIRYGLVAAVLLIVSEVAIVALEPRILERIPIYVMVPIDLVAFARIAVFTSLGIYYCKLLGRPGFPYLIRNLPEPPVMPAPIPPAPVWPAATPMSGQAPIEQALAEPVRAEAQIAPAVDAVGETAAAAVEQPQTAQVEASLCPDRVAPFGSALTAALAVAAGSVVFSVILFMCVPTRMSDMMRKMSEVERAEQGMVGQFTLTALVVVLTFALGEEIAFRLGIQSFLAHNFRNQKHSYATAIVITCAIWTIGHAGITNPEWVKLVQMLPVGLALGWLFGRYGTEACMIAHSLFNVIMLALAPFLISA